MMNSRMKKNVLSLALLLCSAMPVCAQGTEDPVGRFSLTPRVGAVLSNRTGATNPGTGDKSKWHAGFLVGLDAEYRASDLLGVSLGAYYSRQGLRYPDFQIAEPDQANAYGGYKHFDIDFNYIQVPLLAKVYLVPQFAVQAGVQVGFACGDGKSKYEYTHMVKEPNGSITYNETMSQEGSYKSKTDVSIPIGVTYEYMNVVLDARYNIGLVKVGEGDMAGYKNKALTISVGYRFTL